MNVSENQIFSGKKNLNRKYDSVFIESLFSRAEKQAILEYESGLKSSIGNTFLFQKQVLLDAKSGKSEAVNYVFLVCKETIMKTFFSSYVGLFQRYIKINDQYAVEEWIGIAYEVLIGGFQSGHFIFSNKEKKSALETFNVEVFKEDANLFYSFQYWYWEYLRSAAIKENKLARARGLKGYGVLKMLEDFDFVITAKDNIFSDECLIDVILENLDKDNDFVSFCEKLKKLSSDFSMRRTKSYKDISANNVLKTVLQTFKKNGSVSSIRNITILANIKYGTFKNKFTWALSYMKKYGIAPDDFSKFVSNEKYIDKIISILEV
jgi:hypothetical protein